MTGRRKRPMRRGKYPARWRDPDGSQHSKSFDKAGDAERYEAEMKRSVHRGEYIDPAGKTTVAQYASGWLAGLTTDPSSRESAEIKLRLHIIPALGDIPLAALRPSRVQQFVAGLGRGDLSPRYVKAITITLSAVLSAAVADRLISSNPCATVKRPRVPERLVQPWTAEQVAAVRAELPERYRAMVDCGNDLGMRQGEVLGLMVEDINWPRATVVHVRRQVRIVSGKLVLSPPKGGRERDIPLPESVKLRLAEHLSRYPGNGLIFTTPSGGMINRNSLNHRWREALVRAGISTERGNGFHVLRHTFCSYLLSEGASVAAVASWTGDTPATILKYYAHLSPNDDDRMRSLIDRRAESAPDVRAAAE